MRRTVRVALAAGIIAAAIAPSINAHQGLMACNGDVTKYETPAGTIYTDFREELPDINHWVYLETNNHGGLQSGGNHAVIGDTGADFGFTDPCVNTNHTGAKDSILL